MVKPDRKEKNMKKYRILYWMGSITTDWCVSANSAEEAEKKFREIKGEEKEIVKIVEIDEE
jgi:hypothetical protein